MNAPLLRIRRLHASFRTSRGTVRALGGVDLDISRGEVVGIVGESGSGKSVLALSILGLLPRPPASISAEAIEFEGRDLLRMAPSELRMVRGNRIAMVFQDPMTSLNPYLTVGDQVGEPLVVHRGFRKSLAIARAAELLAQVGIPDPERVARAHPHQLSGGMRQRAMIAMAVACEPSLLIADEPTTALDVTIQAQILDLLGRIRTEKGAAVILITHDLGVVAGFCDRVNVLYAGRIAERAPTAALFSSPGHPYTRALLRVVPGIEGGSPAGAGRLPSIPGQPPDLLQEIAGCPFAPRCDLVLERCRREAPPLDRLPGREGRERACFREFPLGGTP